MSVIGIAEVLVKPIFTGVQQEVAKRVGPLFTKAGRSAGKDMGAGMAAGFSAETAGLEAEVSRLTKAATQAETSLSASKAKLAAASATESKALGELRVAELKLQEVRDNGNAKASQIAAAEEKLSVIRRRAADATDRREVAEHALAKATLNLGDAQSKSSAASVELETHLKRVSEEAERTGRSANTLAARLTSAFKGSPLGNLVTGIRRDSDRIRVDLSKMAQDVAREGTRGGRAFTQAFIGVVGGLSAITPAAGAVGAAVLGASGNVITFAASLSSLAGVAALVPAGLMAIGAGAGVLVSAFSGVGEALKTALEGASSLSTANPRLAAMAVEDAMQAISVAEENAADAQVQAARRVSDAKRSLQEVTLAAAEAQKAAAKAVEMAERDEAKAARDVIEAQRDLVKAREDAAKKVETVGRSLEAANLKATDTALAHQRAIEAYDKAASNPKSSDAVLAQLENNVAKSMAADENAKRAVLDLRDEQVKAQEEAQDSNEKVLDAEQRLADARQAQADAIEARKEAQAEVLKQEQDGAKRIADAQMAIQDATEQAQKSQVDAARAVEQAHRNLERVQMQQADTASQSGQKSADAMGKLTPAAQESVRALLAVKEQLGQIRRIAQENFFTGFAAPLLSLAGSVMPQLATGVGAIASALGSGAQIFMRALETSLDGGVLESLLMGVATSTTILNRAIEPVVTSFVTLGQVGMDYMPRLATAIADIATRFNDVIQAAAADGRLAMWIDNGIQGFKDLWSIGGSVAGIFSALNQAAEAGGAVSTLSGMAAALRNIETVMQGPVFQTTMSTIFAGAEAGSQGLLAALGPIGDAFANGATAFADFLRLGGEIAGTFVGGVFTALSNPEFGAGLKIFMEAVQRGVGEIVPLLPGLTGAFGAFLSALAPITEKVGPSLIQVFSFFASSVATLLAVFDPLLVAIAGSPAVLGLLIGAFVATRAASAALTAAGNIQRIVMADWATATKIVTAAQWLWNNSIKAFPGMWIITAIGLVVAGLVWFFTQTELGQQIVQNVWAAIQVAVAAVVDWFQNTAMPIIQQVFAVVGAVFTWLYENIIRPVFEGIGLVVGAWWTVTSYIFQLLGAVIEKIIAPAFLWLYEKVIKPVFGFIGALISAWWTVIIKPIFDGLVWVLNNVLGPAFVWLYENVIKPQFDAIGAVIKWVWENVIKPVFDVLGDFITKTIPKAFEDGVGFIKTAWEKLQDIAKAPVKFVVDTVINDGLINGLNTIGKSLGLAELPRVSLPSGFSEGGVLPGYEARKRDTVLTPMRPGEGVLVPEVVRGAGRGFIDMLNAAGNKGVSAVRKLMASGFHPGRAKGGLIHPLPGSVVSQPFHSGHNGMDMAAAAGTPIRAAGPGRVSSAGWSEYGGGNEIHIDHPNGLQTWYAHLSKFAVKLGQMVTGGSKIGEVGSTGNSTGNHLHYMVMNGGWPSYVNPAEYLDGGGEAGSAGWNPIAGIVDGLVDQFKKAFPDAGMFADMAIGAGKKVLDGAVAFVTGQGGKDDGIGSTGLPYLHDQGGILPPGLSQVVNRTRQPEYILNPKQWEAMYSLATRRGHDRPAVQIGQLHVRDEHEAVRLIETSQRDALAVHR
ncbi:peptidoglycan DD-metalloendopeptidase family protein [Paenarthrobacter nitroguajacolicus]|uniref:peptidoglycan DD-metalloendopeptidase family protein n=1 Tax=Paenarthrobacter nitroguajacolicus TaxID=211146 RepID=UPI003AD8797E